MKTYLNLFVCVGVLCALFSPTGVVYAFAPVATPISETLPISPTIKPIPEPEPMLYDIPQRIEVINKDTFMILPKEAPFPTGTISGPMFSDDIEVVGKEPAFVRKMEQQGWQTIPPTPPEPPVAPEVPSVSNNTAVTEAESKPEPIAAAPMEKAPQAESEIVQTQTQTAPPKPVDKPTPSPQPKPNVSKAAPLVSASLDLPFIADSSMINAELRQKFATFSAQLADKSIKTINVVGFTQAPPFADAEKISQARWQAVKLMLEEVNASVKSAAVNTVFFTADTQQHIKITVEYN